MYVCVYVCPCVCEWWGRGKTDKVNKLNTEFVRAYDSFPIRILVLATSNFHLETNALFLQMQTQTQDNVHSVCILNCQVDTAKPAQWSRGIVHPDNGRLQVGHPARSYQQL